MGDSEIPPSILPLSQPPDAALHAALHVAAEDATQQPMQPDTTKSGRQRKAPAVFDSVHKPRSKGNKSKANPQNMKGAKAKKHEATKQKKVQDIVFIEKSIEQAEKRESKKVDRVLDSIEDKFIAEGQAASLRARRTSISTTNGPIRLLPVSIDVRVDTGGTPDDDIDIHSPTGVDLQNGAPTLVNHLDSLETAVRQSIIESQSLLLDWRIPEAACIGALCKVYWDGENTWFYARILNYDSIRKKHYIYYPLDSTAEWIVLDEEYVLVMEEMVLAKLSHTSLPWPAMRFCMSAKAKV